MRNPLPHIGKIRIPAIHAIATGLFTVELMIFFGCHHKDLCYEDSHEIPISLRFDWEEVPEASPSGMTVYFYPESGIQTGRYYCFHFKGKEGGRISLPEGRYIAVCYNNDSETVWGYEVELSHTHRLLTRNAGLLEPVLGNATAGASVPRPAGTEDEDIVLIPEMMYGCSRHDIAVDVDTREITLYPHELVCHYSFEVRNVKGLENVVSLSGVLTGMSPSLYLSDEKQSEECVTLPVEAFKSDNTTICGEFLTFGHNPEIDCQHKFGLYLWLKDGTILFISDEGEKYDVTEQLHKASNPRRVHFVIDGMEIRPGDGKYSEGWKIDLEDFNNEFIDINL